MYEFLAVQYWYLEDWKSALQATNKAIEQNPQVCHLKNKNKNIFKYIKKIKKNQTYLLLLLESRTYL
jgi:hypothetical protein